MGLIGFLLFQLIAVVLVEMLRGRLDHRSRARVFVWLLAFLSFITVGLGMFLVHDCRGEGIFWCFLGWPLLLLSVPMTAIVIGMCMQLRPRAWLTVGLLVLSLLWIFFALAK